MRAVVDICIVGRNVSLGQDMRINSGGGADFAC